jgi:hypothetical protein
VKVLFSEAELRALLHREEGQFLEFKSLWDLERTPRKVLDRRTVRDAIAEYIAAFANADGGTLYNAANTDQLSLSRIVWCNALHRRTGVTAISGRRAFASRWRTTWRILYSRPRFQWREQEMSDMCVLCAHIKAKEQV